jgi:GNAT superfamily N-acetyltransferase
MTVAVVGGSRASRYDNCEAIVCTDVGLGDSGLGAACTSSSSADVTFDARKERLVVQTQLSLPTSLAYACKAGDGDMLGVLLAQTIVDEVHILQLAVHHRARRRGVASMLMRHLFEQQRSASLRCVRDCSSHERACLSTPPAFETKKHICARVVGVHSGNPHHCVQYD